MTVTKAVVRGILIASLASSSARGGSILYLGVNADAGPDSPSSPSPFPAPAPALQLGVYTDPAPAPASPRPPAPASTFPMAGPAINSVPAPSPVPSLPSGKYDAFINLGSGPYSGAGSLTTGNPQPWYMGTAVQQLYGGLPTLQQAAAFEGTVLQRVQQTFGLSGVPVSLTIDPNAQAAHTISVVSQTSNPTVGGVLGMTYLGGNGFQYIDTAANSATTVNQLEWIVAHNLAHELMLAFNVTETHDQSGQFIDSPLASWSMMTSSNARFSPGAVADLLSKNFQAVPGTILGPSAQFLGAPQVPEPSASLLWVVIGSAALAAWRGRREGRV